MRLSVQLRAFEGALRVIWKILGWLAEPSVDVPRQAFWQNLKN
jgi:hypothetical protein